MPEETEVNEVKYHPLCLTFPLLPQEELQRLGEDLKANGFRFPIVRWHGMIVDGRNRMEACKLVGIDPVIRDKEDQLKTEEDVIHFICSANLARRHLSASERAALAVGVKDAIERAKAVAAAASCGVGSGDPGKASKKAKGEAIQEAAQEAGVSTTYVRAAERLKDQAPEQFEEVKSGKKSLGEATKDAEAKRSGKKGKVIPAEAGEKTDEAAAMKKAEKIVAKCQEKLGELGFRLVKDDIEPL